MTPNGPREDASSSSSSDEDAQPADLEPKTLLAWIMAPDSDWGPGGLRACDLVSCTAADPGAHDAYDAFLDYIHEDGVEVDEGIRDDVRGVIMGAMAALAALREG